MSASGRLINGTAGGSGSAANLLSAFAEQTATTGAATVLTVPAGRTWVGVLALAVAVEVDAAGTTEGLVRAVVTTAGAGVAPAAGTQFVCVARAAANAAGGTAGTSSSNALTVPITVIAPVGNAVTIQLASTITGTNGNADLGCVGTLL